MANYKGWDCAMGEITHMASTAKDSIHEQRVYEYFLGDGEVQAKL